MAFTKQADLHVWINPRAQLLVLDTGTQARADEVTTALIKAIDGLVLQQLLYADEVRSLKDLDIEPVEKPEHVAWVDPTHPAPKA